MIIDSFGESLNNTEYFVAHIAPDNLASQKLFSKCGFVSDFDEIEEMLYSDDIEEIAETLGI